MITHIFGLPGSGKSTLLRSLLVPPYVVVDPLGEMPGEFLVTKREHAKRIDWSRRDTRVVWTCPPWWEFFATLRGYKIGLDEASMLWPHPSQMQPGRPGGLHPCAVFLATHRHAKIHIIGSTQRPKQTPPLARDLAEEIYVFSLPGEAAEYCRKYWKITPPLDFYRWVRYRANTLDAKPSAMLQYVRKP